MCSRPSNSGLDVMLKQFLVDKIPLAFWAKNPDYHVSVHSDIIGNILEFENSSLAVMSKSHKNATIHE